MSKTTPGEKYVPISLSCDKLKGEMYLIKEKDIDKCRDNAQDWKKYFKVCDASDKIDVKPKEFFKLLELSSTENNVLASLSPEEKIKNLFINKKVNLDSEDAEEESEAAEDTYQKVYSDIINRIHRLNVTHLHELDFKAYEKKKGEEKRIIKEQIDNFGLLPESPKTNIFTEADIDFSNNQMTFVHPLYFYNHLKTAGMLEFNPYAGKSITTTYDYFEPIEGKNIGKLTVPCKSNPCFAPFVGVSKYGGYCDCFTQWFNERPVIGADDRQLPSQSSNGKNRRAYRHEGIDMYAPVGKPIKAFGPGIIIHSEGDQGNKEYGKYIIAKMDEKFNDKTIYVLLGHLTKSKSFFNKSQRFTAGETVAYVGNTGNCKTGNDNHLVSDQERADGKGAHLHLQLFISDYDNSKDFIKYIFGTEKPAVDSPIIIREKNIYNPFDYSEGYFNN